MVEKDLYAFLRTIEKRERIESQLKLLNAKINAPPSANSRSYGTQLPGEWLTSAIEKRDKLLNTYQETLSKENEKYFWLLDVADELDNDKERKLFWLLYHDGKSMAEASIKLNYSLVWCYNARKNILSKVAKIDNLKR